jgi:hypothetical protein
VKWEFSVVQQQQRKENVLAIKFMIEVKYRKVLGVCQGGMSVPRFQIIFSIFMFVGVRYA